MLALLDSVDSYIKVGQGSAAYETLKEAEKKAFSAYARLGVYKRYVRLGEKDDADRILKESYEKLPDNQEICAVYGKYLISKGMYSEAAAVTSLLAGGKYGSVNSEATLKLYDSSNDIKNRLLDRETALVFYDLYLQTQDKTWLLNAALVYLYQGDYALASSLQEDYDFRDDKEAYFWALVQFDAGNYDVCINNLEKITSEDYAARASTLMADCYYNLDDHESAQICRVNLINAARKNSAIGVPSSVLVNASIYYKNHQKYNEAYQHLMTAVNNNPEYIPGLITYSRYAYEDSLPRTVSELELAVRQTNIRTDKMREFDERPKYLVSDALYRMDELLEKQHSVSGQRNDLLLAEKAQLYIKTNKNLTEKKRQLFVWNLLEENSLGPNLYPSKLMQFAVHELIATNQQEEARKLFIKYMDTKYSLKDVDRVTNDDYGTDVFGAEIQSPKIEIPESLAKVAFGDRIATSVKKFEIWECETAAYFTLLDGNGSAAKRIYEYAVFETGGRSGKISQHAGINSVVNLAMICSTQKDKRRALELYGLASGRAREPQLKSLILYRMALIQLEMGNKKDAIASLEYAISIDESNNDARLLKRQITTAG